MSELAAGGFDLDGWPHVLRRRLAVVAVALAFLVGLFMAAKYLASGTTVRPKTPPVIHILDPEIKPPEKKPPPEPTKPQIKEVATVEPIDTAPKPPADTVVIEEPGDDNGLAGTRAGTVTDPDHFPAIPGGNGGGIGFNWYGAAVQREVQRYLRNKTSMGKETYVATVRVWLSPVGEVKRVEIATSSGSDETDESLRAALQRMPALKERPPAEMPQPIRLRVSSRA